MAYDGYGDSFANRFGHLFYRQSFSHYVVAVEYRFVGAAGERAGPTGPSRTAES